MTNNNQNPTPNEVKRSECECECHQKGSNISHLEPCCVPDDQTKAKGKDGKDYF